MTDALRKAAEALRMARSDYSAALGTAQELSWIEANHPLRTEASVKIDALQRKVVQCTDALAAIEAELACVPEKKK